MTSSWTNLNTTGIYVSVITHCATGSVLWGQYLHSTPSWDKKHCEIGSIGKLVSSPLFRAYMILFQTCWCWALTKSWRVKFRITGSCSATIPTAIFLERASAATLARPGRCLKTGLNFCTVKNHLARRPDKFFFWRVWWRLHGLYILLWDNLE